MLLGKSLLDFLKCNFIKFKVKNIHSLDIQSQLINV